MDIKMLRKIAGYSEIYDYVSHGGDSVDGLTEFMKSSLQGGQISRRKEELEKGIPLIDQNGDKLSYNKEGGYEYLVEFARILGFEECLTSSSEDLDDDYPEHTDDDIEDYERQLQAKDQEIESLKQELQKEKLKCLRAETEQKILVAGSIEIGPKKDIGEGAFLVDPDLYLDVDACVAKYGGIIEPFYDDIPTDNDDDKNKQPGKEFNEKNYARGIMKVIGTTRFFKKRISDNNEVKAFEKEHGSISPQRKDERSIRQKERDRILKNRFITLNKIIENGHLTNQEKLMMYAMNAEYHNTNVERLLNYAGEHCINAEYLIYLLEDPDVATTYENTVGFLNQFAKASEFKIKRDFARELIEGKWYILGDYKGHKTKFQLVPIEEFNEYRARVGLPVSEFGYLKKDEESDKDPGDIKKPDYVPTVHTAVNGVFDLPDDGFEMPDEDPMPF